MKRAVIVAKEQVELQEFPMPEINSRQVLVEVLACGLCTFEQRYYSGGKEQYPFGGGHEVSGIVKAIGADVKADVTVGDKVVVACITRCGECYFCQNGMDNMCAHGGDEADPGALWGPGGLSEYLVAEGYQVYRVDKDLDPNVATLAEPLACVIRSFEKANVSFGDTVLVTGAGVMGLLHVMVGRMLGLRVIVSEIDPLRSAKAKENGAFAVLDPRDEDFISKIKDITHQLGVQSVLYTAGGQAAVAQSLKAVCKGGSVVLYGAIYPKTLMEIDPNAFHYDEIVLTGLVSTTKETFMRSANLLSDPDLALEELISEVYPLSEIDEAFRRSLSTDTYRVVVNMKKED